MKKLLFLLISVSVYTKDIILLLGGICRSNATYMNKIKNALLVEDRTIIDDTNIDTLDFSIDDQTKVLYNFLIKEKNVGAEDRIIIIGHSQGGLRGYNLYKNYKDKLNILALFTISTPWRGAGILEKVGEIKNKLNNIYRILNTRGWVYDKVTSSIYQMIDKDYIDEIPRLVSLLSKIQSSLGAGDMKLNSSFIEGLNNEVQIPIFNIIGTQMSILDIIPLSYFEEATRSIQEGKHKVNKFYEKANAAWAVPASIATSVLLFPVLGPFSFFFGALAAPAAATATVHSNRDQLLDDLNYLKSSLDFIKNFTVTKNNNNRSDLILNVDEQILPDKIAESFINSGYSKLYFQQQFEIQDSLHDVVSLPLQVGSNSFEAKVIYNKDLTINILSNLINIILSNN